MFHEHDQSDFMKIKTAFQKILLREQKDKLWIQIKYLQK